MHTGWQHKEWKCFTRWFGACDLRKVSQVILIAWKRLPPGLSRLYFYVREYNCTCVIIYLFNCLRISSYCFYMCVCLDMLYCLNLSDQCSNPSDHQAALALRVPRSSWSPLWPKTASSAPVQRCQTSAPFPALPTHPLHLDRGLDLCDERVGCCRWGPRTSRALQKPPGAEGGCPAGAVLGGSSSRNCARQPSSRPGERHNSEVYASEYPPAIKHG